MPASVTTLEILRPQLRKHQRMLGLDLGTKTIGLALSDVERRLASPHSTIQRSKFRHEAAALVALVEEFDIGALVLGLPLNMDGSEGPRVQSTRAFARNLAPYFSETALAGIAFWDERLSTAAVERSLIALDVSRKRRASVVDRMAAAYILQGALDRLAALGMACGGGVATAISECKFI